MPASNHSNTERLISMALAAIGASAPDALVHFTQQAFERSYPDAYAQVKRQAEAAARLDRLLAMDPDQLAGDRVFVGLDLDRFEALAETVETRIERSGDLDRLQAIHRLIRRRRAKLARSTRRPEPSEE